MTTRVNSQFPGPDFHRQDTQPYGLRRGFRGWDRISVLLSQSHQTGSGV